MIELNTAGFHIQYILADVNFNDIIVLILHGNNHRKLVKNKDCCEMLSGAKYFSFTSFSQNFKSFLAKFLFFLNSPF